MSHLSFDSLRKEWAGRSVLPSMLPHLAYYSALSDPNNWEGSADWSTMAAGLIALRLVDRWIARAGRPPRRSRAGVHPATPVDLTHPVLTEVINSARSALRLVEESSPYRPLLMQLIDASGSGVASELLRALFAYAHALHVHARWPLAADVYETIWRITVAPRARPRRALEALQPVALERLGHSRRMMGDLEGAAAAYADARAAAQAARDLVRESRVQISQANLLIHVGNLPAAAAVLDGIIRIAPTLVETRSRCDLAAFIGDEIPLADVRISAKDVLALARHDRGVVAAMQGDHAAAVEHTFFAWRSYRDPIRRERAWSDLARALADIGMRDAARDAFLVLHVTAHERELQWAAAVNLLEMAAIDGQREAFASYRALLEAAAADAALPAWLWAWAVFYGGIGEARFGRIDRARAALQLAVQLAERDRVNEILIRAEAALSALDAGRSPDVPLAPRLPVAPTIERIARLVRRARIRLAEPRLASNPIRNVEKYKPAYVVTASLADEAPTGMHPVGRP